MRAVAAEAGLAVGNVVYHFPSKRGLIRALIFSLVAEYRAKFDEYLRSTATDRPGGLAGLIRWFMFDSVSRETGRLFRELWVMALHDPAIARAMDDFYAQLHRRAAILLQSSHPGLGIRDAHDIVQLMGVISEGSNVIYTTAPRSAQSLQRVAALAGDVLGHAVTKVRRRKRPKSDSTP
jgi:AcrR family transcriptional regulator